MFSRKDKDAITKFLEDEKTKCLLDPSECSKSGDKMTYYENTCRGKFSSIRMCFVTYFANQAAVKHILQIKLPLANVDDLTSIPILVMIRGR